MAEYVSKPVGSPLRGGEFAVPVSWKGEVTKQVDEITGKALQSVNQSIEDLSNKILDKATKQELENINIIIEETRNQNNQSLEELRVSLTEKANNVDISTINKVISDMKQQTDDNINALSQQVLERASITQLESTQQYIEDTKTTINQSIQDLQKSQVSQSQLEQTKTELNQSITGVQTSKASKTELEQTKTELNQSITGLQNSKASKTELEQTKTELNQSITGLQNSKVSKSELETVNTNLSNELKDIHIYVKHFGAKGDGVTDDTTSIQNALNQVSSTKSTVYIPDGTWKITSALKIKSNTHLKLSEKAIILRGSNQNAMLLNDSDGTKGGYEANQNIKVSGGTWDANKKGFPTVCTVFGFGHSENIRIFDTKIINLFDWHMIELNAVRNAKIYDCHFKDYGSETVGTEMVQLDCMKDTSVFPWFSPYDNTPCFNIIIERNTFENGVRAIGTHTSIEGVFHKHIKIKDNHFINLRSEAIKCLIYSHVEIEDNTFIDCSTGILSNPVNLTNPVTDYKIKNNTFIGTKTRPIQIGGGVHDGVIMNNFVDGAGTHGIGVDNSTNWNIEGNTVKNCGQTGIWNYGSVDVVIKANKCYGNNTTATANRFDIAIGYSSIISRNVKILENTCGTLGIQQADLNMIKDNTITERISQGTTITNLVKSNNFIVGVLDA